jgi:hypothetical protein
MTTRSAVLAVALVFAGPSCKTDEAPSPDTDMGGHDAAAGADAAPGGKDATIARDMGGGGADVGAGPALDCTTSSEDYCIAVAGTVNGMAFELTCLPANRDIVTSSASRLALTCHNATQSLTFRVAVPEKGNGTFDLPALETQAATTDLEMLKLTDEGTTAQMNSTAANFSEGRVQLTASADGLRVATFTGSWRTADAGCRAFTYSCAAGSLRGSFRFRRSQ